MFLCCRDGDCGKSIDGEANGRALMTEAGQEESLVMASRRDTHVLDSKTPQEVALSEFLETEHSDFKARWPSDDVPSEFLETEDKEKSGRCSFSLEEDEPTPMLHKSRAIHEAYAESLPLDQICACFEAYVQGDSPDAVSFRTTLEFCMDAVKDCESGLILMVVHKDLLKDLSYEHVDGGRILKYVHTEVKSVHSNLPGFKRLLRAFCQHSSSDRWEWPALNELAKCKSENRRRLMQIVHQLMNQPKEGAFIVSHTGVVVCAAGHLNHEPVRTRLVSASRTTTGLRHAAAVGVMEWLETQFPQNSAKGVIFVRSDSGTLHVLIPCPSAPEEFRCRLIALSPEDEWERLPRSPSRRKNRLCLIREMGLAEMQRELGMFPDQNASVNSRTMTGVTLDRKVLGTLNTTEIETLGKTLGADMQHMRFGPTLTEGAGAKSEAQSVADVKTTTAALELPDVMRLAENRRDVRSPCQCPYWYSEEIVFSAKLENGQFPDNAPTDSKFPHTEPPDVDLQQSYVHGMRSRKPLHLLGQFVRELCCNAVRYFAGRRRRVVEI